MFGTATRLYDRWKELPTAAKVASLPLLLPAIALNPLTTGFASTAATTAPITAPIYLERRTAEKLNDAQGESIDQQNALIAGFQERQTADQRRDARMRALEIERRRVAALSGETPPSTIATSPLGLPGGSPTVKTKLGGY